MFAGFFYVLRDEGMPVTPTEWMTLMEALNQGLSGSSLSGFYYLARAVLVKSEAHYDRYDQAFARYFKGIETSEKLADQVSRWLEKSLPRLNIDPSQKAFQDWNLDELKKALEERLNTQKEEHHGGKNWIGTGGTSRFGHSGYNPAGVRIGGESGNRSAVKVAAERRYRDFRTDETINIRQFEVALKKLRQLSAREEGPREDLDIDGTIEATCKRAGILDLVWEKPRKNTLKVVLMMDSGGSMSPYARLCSQLFTASSRVNHFKDIRFYYFHNCIYDKLFLDPYCSSKNSIKTMDLLNELEQDYRLIMVGDASMAPSELLMVGGALDWGVDDNEPGMVWMERLVRHFHHSVWLNPLPTNYWPPMDAKYDTISLIRRLFPMFELTVEGLERAVTKLKVNK
jgi:uncharacterized protein with von Willebrand factor type A (vWA) domain